MYSALASRGDLYHILRGRTPLGLSPNGPLQPTTRCVFLDKSFLCLPTAPRSTSIVGRHFYWKVVGGETAELVFALAKASS